ncbi:MAG: hypothetical protein R2710_01730 [Acidimicrobiales bacterium]
MLVGTELLEASLGGRVGDDREVGIFDGRAFDDRALDDRSSTTVLDARRWGRPRRIRPPRSPRGSS